MEVQINWQERQQREENHFIPAIKLDHIETKWNKEGQKTTKVKD